MTLHEFLTARLDEDEAGALAAARTSNGGSSRYTRWDTSEWRGSDEPAALVGQGTPGQPLALGHFIGHSIPARHADHIARHDPARVLAEVAAKRQLIDLAFEYEADLDNERGCCHSPEAIRQGRCGDNDRIRALRLLALPHADHPDYRPEWHPDQLAHT